MVHRDNMTSTPFALKRPQPEALEVMPAGGSRVEDGGLIGQRCVIRSWSELAMRG